jgi:beta-1,4-mannosyl-glycoprotein beta-1,4-N-acetylglucosaminyltransferase
MLEIRLHELYEYVTLFLIAESNLTLSGIPKPFYLKHNWTRFTRYHKKIHRVEIPLSNLIKQTKNA